MMYYNVHQIYFRSFARVHFSANSSSIFGQVYRDRKTRFKYNFTMYNYPDKTRKLGCQGWPSILTGYGYLVSNDFHVMWVVIFIIAIDCSRNIVRDLHALILM